MSKKVNTKSFIAMAKEVHGDRYDYSKIKYINSKTKVIIICKIHGEFLQIPNTHLLNSGCPQCVNSRNSKGTQIICLWLQNKSLLYDREKSFDSLRGKHNRPYFFDFFIKKLNILIEFDGLQHYKPIKFWGGDDGLQQTQECDQRKTQWAKDNGYTLIRICYSDEKNIHDMLDHYLKPYITKKKVNDKIVITKEYQRSLLNIKPQQDTTKALVPRGF